ncbi:hypothetical protein TWF132_007994 [Orbilia oligospora]|nr:hypothetical protein TWF132_007994 [Orbilia oligospora]
MQEKINHKDSTLLRTHENSRMSGRQGNRYRARSKGMDSKGAPIKNRPDTPVVLSPTACGDYSIAQTEEFLTLKYGVVL